MQSVHRLSGCYLRTDGRTDMAELIAVILQLFVTHEQRHSVYGLLLGSAAWTFAPPKEMT